MDKLAIVTGGTRGIGEAISLEMQNTGYKVIANYANNEEAAKAFEKNTGIKTYKWNVANFSECQDAIKKIEDDWGRTVDILVNNAGITRDGMFHRMDHNQWSEVINTNLTSCFNMSNAVIANMREKNFGRIINMSSINALVGQIGQTNYSAAKAGILGFTKSLAREVAAKGITVNAIAPGYIETDMVTAIKPEIRQSIVAEIPVKRFGTVKEIARAILFLISEDAGYITGETLSINGGHHMA